MFDIIFNQLVLKYSFNIFFPFEELYTTPFSYKTIL